MSDTELAFNLRELQPLYDILVRLTVAIERIAVIREEELQLSKNQAEMMGGLSSLMGGMNSGG